MVRAHRPGPGPLSPPGPAATFVVYEDRAGEWRFVHDGGNVIAEGGQGCAERRNAVDGIESVRENAPSAPVEVHRVEELGDP